MMDANLTSSFIGLNFVVNNYVGRLKEHCLIEGLGIEVEEIKPSIFRKQVNIRFTGHYRKIAKLLVIIAKENDMYGGER